MKLPSFRLLMHRPILRLLPAAAILFAASGCDTAVDPQPTSQSNPSDVRASTTGRLAFSDSETAFIDGTEYTFTLQAVVGTPFDPNSAEYFVVEGKYEAVDPDGGPTLNIPIECVTSLSGGALSPIDVEDSTNDRFVAFVPRDFVDTIADRNIIVRRSCSGQSGSGVVEGDLQNDFDFSGFPTAQFPTPLSPSTPPFPTSPVFADSDTFGSSSETLNASAARGRFVPVGVDYNRIRSTTTISVTKNCNSTLSRTGLSGGVTSAVIEVGGNGTFVALIPANLGDLFTTGEQDLTFTRTCFSSLGTATVSGVL